MNRPASNIYWREATESFLPSIDEEEIGELLLSELSRHHEAVQAGTVISYSDYAGRMRGKKSTEGMMTDFDSLKLAGEFLRDLLGNWIPTTCLYSTLWSIRKQAPQNLLSIEPQQFGEAIELMIKALNSRREMIDSFLIKQHYRLNGEDVTFNHAAENLSCLFRGIATESASSTDAEDRWFSELCAEMEWYGDSIGVQINEHEVDAIADRHFSSWVAPDEDAVVRFADELAAEFVRRMFESEYWST